MYTVVLKGFSEDLARCGPGNETQRRELGGADEVIEVLNAVKAARHEDVTFDPVVIIQGARHHLEVRKETGGLFLYDKNNLNVQHVPVEPESVFSEGGDPPQPRVEDGAEDPAADTRPPARRGERGKLWGLVGAGILATLLIQGMIFYASSPDPFQPVEPEMITDEGELQSLADTYSGLFREASGEAAMGLKLDPGGSYVLFDGGDAPGDAGGELVPFEEGTYRFAREGGNVVILLGDTDIIDIEDDDTLDFYGFSLVRSPEGEAGS